MNLLQDYNIHIVEVLQEHGDTMERSILMNWGNFMLRMFCAGDAMLDMYLYSVCVVLQCSELSPVYFD